MKIEVGRYDNNLRRLLNAKGAEHVAGELAPELSAVLALEVDRPEWEWLRSCRLVARHLGEAAVAAENAVFSYRNPGESGMISVVRKLEVFCGSAVDYIVRIAEATTDLTDTNRTVPIDTRWFDAMGGAAGQLSPMILSGDTVAGGLAGQAVYRGSALANTPFSIPFPVILSPGFRLSWECLTVNVRVDSNVYALERRAEALERGP